MWTPKNRLQKILVGENVDPYTNLEHAVKVAVTNAGNGGGDNGPLIVSGTVDNQGKCTITESLENIKAAFDAGREVYLEAEGMRLNAYIGTTVGDVIIVAFAVTAYDAEVTSVYNISVAFVGDQTVDWIFTRLTTSQT